jgi:hypothetical protein
VVDARVAPLMADASGPSGPAGPGPGAGGADDGVGLGPVAGTGGRVAPAVGREARPGLRGGRRAADVVATVVLLVVGVLVAIIASYAVAFSALAFRSCATPGNRCDEAVGTVAVTVGPVAVGVVLLLAVVVSVVRMVRARLAWPVAFLGLGLVVGVAVVARLLASGAVTVGI